MKYLYSLFLVMGIAFVGHAQVGIGTSVPNASAQLDVVSTDKGMLIPRVPLTSTSDKTTIVNGNVNGLIVFNTQTRADVVPGFYYWSDNKWNKIIVSEELQNIIVPTTNNLSILNEYLTSDVNGVTSTIDLTSVVSAATTNNLQLNKNNLISTVNGKVAQSQAVGVVENVISGTYLTTSVNGVDAKSVDLKDAVKKATTNDLKLKGNELTSLVNGVSSSTDAVGNLDLTLNGTDLVIDVNGLTSSVKLADAVSKGTSNDLDLQGNILTSLVNGVSSTTSAVGNLDLTLNGTDLVIDVNGLTSSVKLADAVSKGTSNDLDLQGNILTSLVNGVSSTTSAVGNLDLTLNGTDLVIDVNGLTSSVKLADAVSKGTSNDLDLQGNILTSLVNGVSSTTSAVGNLDLTLNGTDLVIDVNGLTSSVKLADAVSKGTSNDLDLQGNILTSLVNGVSSTTSAVGNLDLTLNGTDLVIDVNGLTSSVKLADAVSKGTSNDLDLQGNILTSLVNGVSSTTSAVGNLDLTLNGTDLVIDVNGLTSSVKLADAVSKGTSNDLDLQGNILTSLVNGVSSTTSAVGNLDLTLNGTDLVIDVNGLTSSVKLADAVSKGTSNDLDLQGNILTSLVNGVSSTTSAVGNLDLTLNGTDLVIDVNGLTSSVKLADAVSKGTSNDLDLQGNILTSLVNGVSSTTSAVGNLDLTLNGTDLVIDVNGLTSSVKLADAVSKGTSNDLDLQGNILTSLVNGVSSTTSAVGNLDLTLNGTDLVIDVNGLTSSVKLADAVSKGTSNDLDLQGNILTSLVNGVSSTTSAVGNLDLTLNGTDLVIDVNGLTSSVKLADAVSKGTSNDLDLQGNILTSLVNGVSSTTSAVGNLDLTLNGTDLVIDVNGLTSSVKLADAVSKGTSNDLDLQGNILTSLVNGVSSTTSAVGNLDLTLNGTDLVIDVNGLTSSVKLADAVSKGTSNDLDLQGNILTSLVNGVSSTTSAVGNLDLTLNGTDLVIDVNGLTSSVKLADAVSKGTSNDLDLQGNILTSLVNGVSSTTSAVGNLDLTLNGTDLVIDVNGLTSSVKLADAVSKGTSNDLDLQGNILTSLVNGVSSTTSAVGNLDLTLNGTDLVIDVNGLTSSVKLADAVSKGTSNDLKLKGNTLTSLVNGVSSSTDAVGSVSNTLNGKKLSTTVNGVTGAEVDLTPLLNNYTSVSNLSSNNDLSTTVNGVTGTAVKIINSNIITAVNGELVSTVNGVKNTNTTNVLISGSNGLTVKNGEVTLGGTLTQKTVLTTSAANTLAISGLQPTNSITTDKILVVDEKTGELKTTSSIVNAISTKTSDYTAVLTDETLLVDAIGGNVTITLPAASALIGKKYAIKKIDKTTNNVVINTGGGTIDTEKSITGSVWLQRWVIQSDGANWYIIN